MGICGIHAKGIIVLCSDSPASGFKQVDSENFVSEVNAFLSGEKRIAKIQLVTINLNQN